MKLLYVDDCEQDLMIFENLIKRDNYFKDCKLTLVQDLNKLYDLDLSTYNVIVSDLILAELGYCEIESEKFWSIHKPKNTPLIAFSGVCERGEPKTLKGEVFDYFIEKGLGLDILLRVIKLQS
jgi:hypothetical protein